jgi:hypothetical protein
MLWFIGIWVGVSILGVFAFLMAASKPMPRQAKSHRSVSAHYPRARRRSPFLRRLEALGSALGIL